jgi:hypothetical protein
MNETMAKKKPTSRIPKLFTAIKRIWDLNKNDEVHPIQGR